MVSQSLKTPNENLPDDGLKTQRESLRKGLVRTNTAAVAILLVVIALALAAILEADRAGRERARAVQAGQEARERLWRSYEAQARGARASSQAGHRFESLEALRNAGLIHSALELRNDAIASLTAADLRLAWSLPKSPCAGVSLDQNFERYALADAQGRIEVRQCADDRVFLELPALTNAVQFVFPFSPGGRFLPVTYADGLTRLWDLAKREVLLGFRVWWPFQTIDFNPDDSQLVTAEEDGQITFHDLATGGITRIIQAGFTRPWVRFNPDGRLVGVFSPRSKDVSIVDSASGEVTKRISHPDVVRGLAWHPEGQLLATGCADFSAYLWSLRCPASPIRVFSGHQSSLVEVVFHPNGQLLLSSSWDGTTRLWDMATAQELARLVGGGKGMQFSRDGKFIAFRPTSGTCKLEVYEVAASRAVRFLNEDDASPENAPAAKHNPGGWWTCFSKDERYLGAAGKHGLRVWDLRRGTESARLSTNEAFSVFFHPDGRHLIGSGRDGLFRWSYDSTEGDGLRFSRAERLVEEADCEHAGLSQDGGLLAYGSGGRIRLLGTNQTFPGWPGVHWVAVSPDGRWVAASAWSFPSGVRLWEPATGAARDLATRGPGYLAFSPDSRYLATGANDEDCLWDLDNPGTVRRLPRADTAEFHGTIAFSPDKSLIARARSFTQIELLDARTLDELARLESPVPQLIAALEFSPSSDLLAVATETPFIQIWDLPWLRGQLASLGLDWGPNEPGPASSVVASSFAGTTSRSSVRQAQGTRQPQMLAVVVGGVVLAIGLAVFVLRRHQTLVVGYQRLDDLAMQRTKDLEAAQRELIHSEKMKALGTLAAGIAHDFNNLLSVIRLSNDVIGQEAGDKPSVREEVESIENAVLQGRAVVRSMLGYSRESADKACLYVVGDVLADTVALLSKQFLGGIVLTMDVARATPQVWGAPSRLEQILLNLIVNAAEAMKGHGRLFISVKASRVSPDENFVLRPLPAEESVEVSVTDSGPGIASELLPRIFEPFFTTKIVGSSPGTGLGLSTVYTIAQQDGLGLAVDTTVGRGTTFRILLPAAERSPQVEVPKENRKSNSAVPVAI